MRYQSATPIQEAAIPAILEGKDVIACAQTGTGKTAAYLIPALQIVRQFQPGAIRALVISPTRELAFQIEQNLQAIGYYSGITSVAVYGGNDSRGWDTQRNAIQGGVDFIIATPGRFLMHLGLGYMDLSQVEIVILDEADKMLDMGFHADIMKIMEQLPKERQTLMFSATMPKKIRQLAHDVLREPVEINFNLAKPAAGISQQAYCVYEDQKIPLLQHLIKTREIDSMIIFSSSKLKVDEIHRKLTKLGVEVRAMHSDKEQAERTETLSAFKNKQFKILVGTDVLARGIDVDNLSHVLNFDCPKDAEDYVHRVGRTARASRTGEAITFVDPRDFHRLSRIERLIEAPIPKPEMPEFLGETPVYDPNARPSKGGSGGGGHKGGRSEGRGGSGQGPRYGEKKHFDKPPRRDPQPRNTNGSPAPVADRPQEGPVNDAEQKRKRRKKKKKKPGETGPAMESPRPTPAD